jgi:S1-C subfamily serine protease
MARIRFFAYAFFVLFGMYVLIEVNHLRAEASAHRRLVTALATSQADMLRQISTGQERLSHVLSTNAQDWRTAMAGVSMKTDSVLARAGDLKGDIRTLVHDTVTEIVHREIDPRTKAIAEAIDRSSTYTARLAKLEPQMLASCRSDAHLKRLKQSMIYPTVQLRGKGTVGSGVIVWSGLIGRKGDASTHGTYVLTAYHVITEVTTKDRPDLVEDVRLMGVDDRLGDMKHQAQVITFDRRRDIALLSLELDERAPYVATFASPEDTAHIEVFEPAYAVGCPLGNMPLPTAGEISTKYKLVEDQVFWMLSAPTFFGNSGGGIFRAQDGKLIGISSMVYTYGRSNPVVVPHLGLFVPSPTICEWLDEEGYAFVHDSTKKPPADIVAFMRNGARSAAEREDRGVDDASVSATADARKE